MPVESAGGPVKTGTNRPRLVWIYPWVCMSLHPGPNKFPDDADVAGSGTLPWRLQPWSILEVSKTLTRDRTICCSPVKCPISGPSLDLAKRLCNQISLRGQLLAMGTQRLLNQQNPKGDQAQAWNPQDQSQNILINPTPSPTPATPLTSAVTHIYTCGSQTMIPEPGPPLWPGTLQIRDTCPPSIYCYTQWRSETIDFNYS